MMTAAELIELLEDVPGDTEIRLATQPNWPFEHSITRAEAVETTHDEDGATTTVVYLAEGAQLRYLPGYVAEALGWAER